MDKVYSDGWNDFPLITHATKNGRIGVGGSLAPDRLIAAYSQGIFPWYDWFEPIMWHVTNPRFVLFPDEIKITKSMQTNMRTSGFVIRFNQDFEAVIQHCASIKRKDQYGTWIHKEMIEAYTKMHQLGYAKSVAVYKDEKLVGGLYGMDMGAVFCGESMFSLVPNASKAALIYLCKEKDYKLIDCQVHSQHLERMGARMIDLGEYLKILKEGLVIR